LASGKFSYKYFLIVGLFLIPAGCSVEKNTGSTRFFNGLTSRYNIYFNGNESFKAGVARVNAGYSDDFSTLLKIFEYSDPATVSMCSADMERAIQKASKVISLKSITAKPETKGNDVPSQKDEEFMNRKEYNEWVDDCYLLLGKARLYKRDYDLAKSTLGYNISSSTDEKIRAESTIWLARIYNETGNYNESFRILNGLDLSVNFSQEMKGLYYTTLADLFMKQKRYDEAIDPLGKALENISGKRNHYRLNYLLAQLCEKTGDGARATVLYKKVANMNPPYEYEFNARINLAGVFDVNSGDSQSIKKELEKMLRSSKNKEFQDQIYFALGNLMMHEKNDGEAINYFIKSAEASAYNQTQKGRSYLALADYFFAIPDYLKAGKYYDSSMFFLDQKYADYAAIKSKSQNLNLLINQVLIIQREDSLQMVANMSTEERNAFIGNMIAKVQEDEAAGKNVNNNDMYNLGQFYENEQRSQNTISQEGRWYFYNQSALTFGRTEFRRRWGDRKLEDNWRRINKSRINVPQGSGNQEEKKQVAADTIPADLDNKKPEFYLRDLPLTDSLMSVSNDRIASAYLESGKIYDEKFLDKGMAVKSFEFLLSHFPGSPYEPETMYSLYMVLKGENATLSEGYRQRLLEKYPENEFSKILSDPDYYNKKQEQLREAEKIYQTAYDAYIKEDFATATATIDEAITRFPKHELVPKFLLLRSYCIARTSDEKTFKEELSKLVKSWPGTPESEKALEMIAYLNKEIPLLQVEEDKQIAAEIYVEERDSPHSFIIIIQNPAFNVNQASFDVISYNIDNYTNNNYRTQGTLVDDKFVMLTVSGFANTGDAMKYYTAFNLEQIVRNPSNSRIMKFIIGKGNLEALLKDKNPERYRLFFNEKYLDEAPKK
jgi:predicted negative regulator of RcsB-dependent stress response